MSRPDNIVKNSWYGQGQIFIMLTLIIPVILLFMGMAVDFGLAYVDETTLGKAVDAAALEGARVYAQGAGTAQTLATDEFNANVGSGLNYSSPPTMTFNTSTVNNATYINVTGTVYIAPYFLQFVPGVSHSLPISESAQATRAPLVMCLTDDRSGSMRGNGGAGALPKAVADFIANFDNLTDRVAEVSFSTEATVDVPPPATSTPTSPPEYNFRTDIDSVMNKMGFGGGTFSQQGLYDCRQEIEMIPVPIGSNIVRVQVFFTDGWANMEMPGWPTSGLTAWSTLAPKSSMLPAAGESSCCTKYYDQVGGPYGGTIIGGGNVGDAGMFFTPYSTPGTNTLVNPVGSSCTGRSAHPYCDATTFPAAENGGAALSLTETNVNNDSTWLAEQEGSVLRNQDNTLVYAIGLGDAINKPFLCAIANDPAASGTPCAGIDPTYDSNQPIGEAAFAPSASQLDQVFAEIASKILLRLTQ
ncbi:MAG: pilus assembly protein TadG-related protein [Candidatus Binataceae bacterium]